MHVKYYNSISYAATKDETTLLFLPAIDGHLPEFYHPRHLSANKSASQTLHLSANLSIGTPPTAVGNADHDNQVFFFIISQ